MLPFVDALRAEARRIGASFRITSAYRSPQLQEQLRSAWRLGEPVPGRAGWRRTSRGLLFRPAEFSYHTTGLAIDIESDRLSVLGAFAEGLGMRWGGRFGDPVHFDLGRQS